MKTPEELQREDRIWQNELDAKKYLIQVHDERFRDMLGTDFKLAKLDGAALTQKQQFILDMLSIGQMALDLVPHPDIAHQIKDMDFLPIKGIAVLSFNVDKNMIIDRTTGWGEEKNQNDQDNEKEDAWIDKIKKKMGQGKNKMEEQ